MKRIETNGYWAIYKPEHPRAYGNGTVYEHILVAEEKLGRFLKDGECVHHRDLNRKNNDKRNLMVFASDDDHKRYHAYGFSIPQSDGTYISAIPNGFCVDGKDGNKITKKKCPICGSNFISMDSIMCNDCRTEKRRMYWPSKKELFDLVLNGTPFVKIGKMYGVSDKAIVKRCIAYGIPSSKKEIKAYKEQKEFEVFE